VLRNCGESCCGRSGNRLGLPEDGRRVHLFILSAGYPRSGSRTSVVSHPQLEVLRSAQDEELTLRTTCESDPPRATGLAFVVGMRLAYGTVDVI
jgi:hypothetical protein